MLLPSFWHLCACPSKIYHKFGSILFSWCRSFSYQETEDWNILQLLCLCLVKIKCFILINIEFWIHYSFLLGFNIMKYFMQHFVKTKAKGKKQDNTKQSTFSSEFSNHLNFHRKWIFGISKLSCKDNRTENSILVLSFRSKKSFAVLNLANTCEGPYDDCKPVLDVFLKNCSSRNGSY